MKESIKTVFQGGTGEIEVKKSRFIATVWPVETEGEAIALIEGLKKKFWDASHNCSAYILGTENPLMRCSDDGEPAGTAGRPMLNVLLGQELTNLLVVVTRYFGGTLLGTGGLVKAYQSAVQEGLRSSKLITKELGIQLKITTDYNMVGKFQYLAAQEHITILSSVYTDLVELTLLVPPSRMDFVAKKIAELSNGSAILEILGETFFTVINGEVHLF